MGYVSRRGKVWVIRYELPPGSDGERRQKSESCKGLTKPEAEARLAEIERKIKYGIEPEIFLTVSQWVNEWMQRESGNWTLETFRKYEQTMRIHVQPEIGDMKLADVRPVHIQKLIDKKLQTHVAKTINGIRGFLHRVFECALKSQAISVNPVDAVMAPRVKRAKVVTADKDELGQIMSAVSGSEIEMIVRLAVYTGLRRGELCGLKWGDLNIATGTLTVQRSITQVKGIVAEKPTKTDSPRQIKLSASLLTALKSYKARLKQSGDLNEWMCVRAGGAAHTPNSLEHHFRRKVLKAGLKTTLHSLRHTHATMLINAGVPVKVVSERLGHSTTTITQNLYTHVLPHMQDQAATVLEDELNGIE